MKEENVITENQTEEMEQNKKTRKPKKAAIWQWLKIPAVIACVISMFGIIASAAGMLLMWENNIQPEDVQSLVDGTLLEAYGRILVTDTGMPAADKKELDGLDGGSIHYTVTETRDGQNETVLYSNDPAVTAENCMQELKVDEYTHYRRIDNTQSLSGLLAGVWLGQGDYVEVPEVEAEVSDFVYAKDKGLFYCHAGEQYFLLDGFELMGTGDEDDVGYFYQLSQRDGGYCYVSTDSGSSEISVADAEAIGKWIDEGYEIWLEGEITDFVMMDSRDIPEDSVMEYGKDYDAGEYYIHTGMFSYSPVQGAKKNVCSVYMSLGEVESGKKFNNGVVDYFQQAERLSNFAAGFLRYSGIWILLSFAVFFISFVYLLAQAGRVDEENRQVLYVWDKIPLGVLTFLAGGLIVILMTALVGQETAARFAGTSPVIWIAAFVVSACIGIAYCMSIASRIKAKKFWRYTILYYLFQPLKKTAKKMRSNLPLFVKGLLILTGISFLELCVLSTWDGDLIFFCFFWYKVVEYLAFIHILYQIDQIDKGCMRTAAGNYSQPVQTRKMLWEFKRIAENINHVSDGISVAVEEKMKSERFKTELITNVSHDIKTPLTSIINYVDLIKKEEITNETMQEYVEVLDRQSQRLKKLIEDLMEASKASTGSLPVHMELCDATVMLTQVIGEFKERAEQNQLELVVESPKPPVFIMADGRHLWRVIDNLMSNICKYAMPGTRVYITLEQFHGMVIMTFRNISKSRLNISSEELMERFVRGDSSRNTEGSGLGLSIAQSLTGLMNGNMAIQIDGDLFKAIVSFQEVVEKKG